MSAPIRFNEPQQGSSRRPRFAICTLGRKLNQTDETNPRREVHSAGLTAVPISNEVDVYIVNTCTVTHLSDRRLRQTLRRFRRTHQQALMAAGGSYPQTSPGELEETVITSEDGRQRRSGLTENYLPAFSPESFQLQTDQITDVRLAEPFRDGVCAALAGPVK